MKQEKLKEFVDKLQNDRAFAITVEVFDKLGNSTIPFINATNEKIAAEYGSVVNFFEQLSKNSNVAKVVVNGRKQNGHYRGRQNWKQSGQPFEFSFVEQPKQQAAPVMPTTPVVPQAPMLNASLSSGLTGMEAYRVFDYDRVTQENQKLIAKNEVLEEKVKELEKQVLTNDLLGTKSVEKTKAQAEFMEKGSAYMPFLMQLLNKNNPSAQGLGQPASPQVDLFSKLDVTFQNELLEVAKLISTNTDAEREYNEFLQKHNLLENAS